MSLSLSFYLCQTVLVAPLSTKVSKVSNTKQYYNFIHRSQLTSQFSLSQTLSADAKTNNTETLMQCRRVKAESITHKYYNSSTKPKFYKNTKLIGKMIEKTSLANFYSKNTHNINNLSIKSIYRNIISPTPFKKRNNKPTST